MARTGRPKQTSEQRADAVLQRIVRSPGCWTWAGFHRKQDGRPYFRRVPAYRAVWEVLVGGIEDGSVLHHECENPQCVRPGKGHVSALKSQSAHMQAHGVGGDWGQAAKTHCRNGHEYTPENTYVYRRVRDGRPSTERHCRTCRKAAKTKYRKKVARA